ncbi:helix-turn-helix domain-containing protein [Rummeliibacillus stabekisii]|uniref:helix-turn-helix domain-containing protein n=1 Tax=Rummeliibacillus stabekisii TaxID=241244 RepID=UPI003713203A
MAFEYLEQYSLFETVEEMDKAISERIDQDRFELTKSERAIVFAIKAHCLQYPGACHLKNETIAKEVGVSLITVSRAIKKLVELKIIGKENKVKLNGIKGANVYYFLPQNDVSSVTYREEATQTNKDKGLNVVEEEGSIKSFNLLKQALQNNNIYSNEDNEPVSEESKEQKIKQYGNEYQQSLYNVIRMMPFAESIVNAAYEISLALVMETKEDFILAKDTIKRVSMDMLSHLRVSSTARAVVEAAYNKARNRRDSHSNLVRCNWLRMEKRASIVEEQASVKPSFDVTKYNWLGN